MKDDAFEFPGDHYIVANGYDTIYENLATKAKDMGVEFRLGQEVKSIELENDKVNLSIRDLTSDNQVGWEIAKKIFPIEMNVRICIPHTIFFKILKNILIEIRWEKVTNQEKLQGASIRYIGRSRKI